MKDRPKLIFPREFDEHEPFEAGSGGYLRHLQVELPDGKPYPAFLIDPVRLRQELDDEVRAGRPF